MKAKLYSFMMKHKKLAVGLFIFSIIQWVLIISHGGFYAAMAFYDAAPETCEEVSGWCHEVGPFVVYDIDSREMYPVAGLNMTGIEFMRLMPRIHEKLAETGNGFSLIVWAPVDDIFYDIVLITHHGEISAVEAVRLLDDPKLQELIL
jgi:hypothetical protein